MSASSANFTLNLSKHPNASAASSFSTNSAYAVSFGDQCTAVGDSSSVFVRVPAVSKTGTNFERLFSTAFNASSSSASSSSSTCIGYGTTANHVIAAFSPSSSSSSSLTLLEVDPLAVVSTSNEGVSSPEEAAESGCHTFRQLTITSLNTSSSSQSSSNSSNLQPVHFASIGNVSGVLILRDPAESKQLLAACIPNIPELVAEQTSQQNVTIASLSPSVLDICADAINVTNAATIQVLNSVRTAKHKIVLNLSEGFSFQIDQNNLTEKISISKYEQGSSSSSEQQKSNPVLNVTTTSSSDSVPLQLALKSDDYRPLQEECCICMMNLFPSEDEGDDVMPAVCILSCGHAYHRGCVDMDLKRVDEFIKQGRYFRFRRLGCSQCSSSMHDALRFPALEKMFSMRRAIDVLAKELDAKSGGSAGDDESLEDRLKRHLFYSCNTCTKPFYGGPYDCGATLSDPMAKPETLICDECCDDFVCSSHGRSAVVYKCQNCWNPAIPNKRFLGRLRLCGSCFDAQKGKPVPGDEVVPVAVQMKKTGENNNSVSAAAAPTGSPFAFLGASGWAVCGHNEEGVGLSVAGCGQCDQKLGAILAAASVKPAVSGSNDNLQDIKKHDDGEGKEKSPDAAEK